MVRMPSRLPWAPRPFAPNCPNHLPVPKHAGATLFSFLVALVFFLSELFIFKTLSLKCAASPMVVAGMVVHAMYRAVSPHTHGAWHELSAGPSVAAACNLFMARHGQLLLHSRASVPGSCVCARYVWMCVCPSHAHAGVSSLWMTLGFNYYTYYSKDGFKAE